MDCSWMNQTATHEPSCKIYNPAVYALPLRVDPLSVRIIISNATEDTQVVKHIIKKKVSKKS
jgi:hypothetical protein